MDLIEEDEVVKHKKRKIILDKNRLIDGILNDIVMNNIMKKLGPNPTKEQREKVLNDLKEKLKKYE